MEGGRNYLFRVHPVNIKTSGDLLFIQRFNFSVVDVGKEINLTLLLLRFKGISSFEERTSDLGPTPGGPCPYPDGRRREKVWNRRT